MTKTGCLFSLLICLLPKVALCAAADNAYCKALPKTSCEVLDIRTSYDNFYSNITPFSFDDVTVDYCRDRIHLTRVFSSSYAGLNQDGSFAVQAKTGKSITFTAATACKFSEINPTELRGSVGQVPQRLVSRRK